jgi:SOS response regulatory protein OraA/RecX
MPTVTALRERRGLVAIELDGAPWRTVPVAAAAEAWMTVGCVLDRERARALARALRRQRARDTAVRAVARREHSRATLEARLERSGVREAERAATVEAAARAGLVDDARFAETRARHLASRGSGDLLILTDLERSGIDDATARRAVAVPGAGADPGRANRGLARRQREDASLPRVARILRGVGGAPRCRPREPGARMTVLHSTFPCTRVRSEPLRQVTLPSPTDLSSQRPRSARPPEAAPA